MPVKTPTSKKIISKKVADQKEEVENSEVLQDAVAKSTPAKAKQSKATPIKKETPSVVPKKVKTPKSTPVKTEAQPMKLESSKKRSAPEPKNIPAKNQKTESDQNSSSNNIEAKKSIYIKGFGDAEPERVKELFSAYGEIVDFKVTKDYSSETARSVIIEFSTVEEAEAALNKDGTEIHGKVYTLSVTPAKSRTNLKVAETEKRVVYVGNLVFQTTLESFTQKLEELGIFPTDIKLKSDGEQFRGFGYLIFNSTEEANKVVQKLDGFELNGRKVRAQISSPRTQEPSVTSSRENSSNLFVGQLNFKTTENTILEAFKTHGCKISKVRIILHENGLSKGFGYVEFNTVEDAKKAYKLNGALEIDGRVVKLDFADKDQPTEAGTVKRVGRGRTGRGGRGHIGNTNKKISFSS